MSHFYEMDWNSKWDWESFSGFSSKATESPKKRQLVDWTIIDDGEIDPVSFNLSTGAVNSGASGSDGAKSSISASDSPIKEGMQTPDFRLKTFEDFSGNFSKKMEMKAAKFLETPPLEASIGSVEPLIGLKLGKRTYFENNGTGANVKGASLSAMPTPSTASLKKTKPTGQNHLISRCVVEGCNIDLSTAKEYHRKHRVCDSHSKCPKVIVGGLERRFCQQCSRFHNLSEFDEKKRSCRRRLSDHNARRRKPQQETIQFNSTRLSSTFYGGRQQMSFLLNNAPLIHSRNLVNTSWDSSCNSKFTLTKGGPSKSNGDGVSGEQMQIPHFINMQSNAAKGLLTTKSFVTEVLNPGSKECQFSSSSHSDAAPEYGRALSLLSNDSYPWASCGPESMPSNPMHETDTQPMMLHGIPEGVPLSSSNFFLPQPQLSTHPPRLHSFGANTNFQEFQLLTTPYESDLYSTMLN